MLRQLLKKKLSGSCQIRIFTLSKVLTLMEVILAILVAVFMMGAEINGTDLFGCPVGTWYEWLIDIIIILCLGLEYLGLQKKIFGIIVFSCVFRCIILLCSFGGVILVCVYIYFMDIMKQWMESGLLDESDPELSETLKCIESPFWKGCMAYLVLDFFYSILKTYLQIKICTLSKRVSVQKHGEDYNLANLRDTEEDVENTPEVEDVEK